MTSADATEHFVTVFDSHYLPLGASLHRSLGECGRPFHLWIVAMDDACARALARMQLGNVTIVRLEEVEDEALRAVKPGRSVGEYCWTLTPFLPSYVFGRMPELERVTYLDADLFFFQSPRLLLDELRDSGKHVLITEHAFAPEYADRTRYGRFCVQFVTFRNTEPARRILRWWQERCLEWCFAREENGKFGDQKYLDHWPTRFAAEVHVLSRTDRTVAPWNVAYLERTHGLVRPVFYHFHSLRIVSARRLLLYHAYYIGRGNRWIYDGYLKTVRSVAKEMRKLGIPVVGRPLPVGPEGGGPYAYARRAHFWARLYLNGTADWAWF